MRFLLDTHSFLWWLFDDDRLSPEARSIIAEPSHQLYVSSASAWEIATKYRLGRLDSATELVQDISDWVARARMLELPVTIAHAQQAGLWTAPHRDPFDRMLAAQCALESVPLISRDPAFAQFGIPVVW